MSAETEELKELPFDNIIGGPLNAVVNAQWNSSMCTLNFIKSEAITDKNGNIHDVHFRYKKQTEVKGQMVEQDAELCVPILTILPIPMLRIDSVLIKFHAEISSMCKQDNTETRDRSREEKEKGGVVR